MSDQPATSRIRSARRATLRATSLLALLVAAVVGALLVSAIWRFTGALRNPFATEEVDRTGPALITALTDMARVEGSSGTFQVVVDVQDDAKYVPAALKGERIIYLAQGTASGTVDLSNLNATSIIVNEELKTATIVVPKAEISNVRIDLTKSKVLSHERGLLDRIGGAVGDTPAMHPDLVARAETQINEAAVESQLRQRAEENTTSLLRSIATGLGYTTVTVQYR
jgi:Protein of unknown function (DUF4230)